MPDPKPGSTFFLSYHKAQEAARRKRQASTSSSPSLHHKGPTDPHTHQASLAHSKRVAAAKKAEMLALDRHRFEASQWQAQRTLQYQREWAKKEVPGIMIYCPKGVHLLPCHCTEVKTLAGGPPILASPSKAPNPALTGLSAPSTGSNQAFVRQYLFEKAQYELAGTPEASRSKRFLDDQRLAEAFILRDKRAAEAREAVANHKLGTLGLSTRPAPPPIKPTPLSHWVGGPTPAAAALLPVAHWRDRQAITLRILGGREVEALTSAAAATAAALSAEYQKQHPNTTLNNQDDEQFLEEEDESYEGEGGAGGGDAMRKERGGLGGDPSYPLLVNAEPPDPYQPPILKSHHRKDRDGNWIAPSGEEYKEMMAKRKALNEAKRAAAPAPSTTTTTGKGRRDCCCGFDSCTFPRRPRRVRDEELDTFQILAVEGKELRRVRAEAGGKAMHDIACCCGRDECNWHRSQDEYLRLKEKTAKKKNPWDSF